jgi:hypothetical protein
MRGGNPDTWVRYGEKICRISKQMMIASESWHARLIVVRDKWERLDVDDGNDEECELDEDDRVDDMEESADDEPLERNEASEDDEDLIDEDAEDSGRIDTESDVEE